jgi:hypothetical protein
MSSMHFYAWRSGLKTGQYYFRSRPARDAIKFTVNVESLLQAADKGNTSQVMECLNLDNGKQQNLLRKKSRTLSEKPESGSDSLKQTIKRPAPLPTMPVKSVPLVAKTENKENAVVVPQASTKEEEDSDSYEFNPVCENCAG